VGVVRRIRVLDLSAFSTLPWASGTATLLGTVTDNTGAAVPNAQVQILESATGIQHAGVTNESGNFTFPNLTPGNYTVTAESQGLQEGDTHQCRRSGEPTTTRVDLALEPGSINETIEVTAAPPFMQTDRADVSANLEAHTLAAMPVAGQSEFPEPAHAGARVGQPVFQHSNSLTPQVPFKPSERPTAYGNSFQIEGVDDDERTVFSRSDPAPTGD